MWEKCWEFSSGASGQVLLKFYLEPPRGGEWKIAKIIGVHWPRWLPCLYMINAFKTQHFQNWGCHIADSLHKSSGTGSIPKLLKWWSYIDIWPFYGEITFASVCIWMGSKWKKCWYIVFSTDFSSEASGSVLLKFHVELLLGRRKRLLKWAWSIDQNGCHAHTCIW